MHVVVGISHDAGYAPFLQRFAADKSVWNRITLLEGPDVNPTMQSLGFTRHLKLPTVFTQGPAPTTPNSSAKRQATPFTTSPLPDNKSDQGPYEAPGIYLNGPILRDSAGFRIDKLLNVRPGLTDVIKGKKLCPKYYLRGFCKGCTRDHSHPLLNSYEYDALWALTRQGSCLLANCDDATCMLGHKP